MDARRADRMQGEAVTWAWDDRIPFGEVTALAGDSGTSKSTFACWLTAELTHGRLSGREEDVYLIMSEDHATKTVRPRLGAANAKLSRVHIETEPHKLAFPGSGNALNDIAAQLGARIIVIDPLDSFIRNGARGREGIDELKIVAQENDLAIVLIHHINRGKVDPKNLRAAIGGGRGLLAAMRSIFFWGTVHPTAYDQEELPDGRCVGFIQLKNNYAEVQSPVLFTIEQVEHPWAQGKTLPRFRCEGDWPLTGDNMVAPENVKGPTKEAHVRELIITLLEEAGGEMRATDLQESILAAGMKQRTFDSARAKLVEEGFIDKTKRADGWYWHFVKAPDVL